MRVSLGTELKDGSSRVAAGRIENHNLSTLQNFLVTKLAGQTYASFIPRVVLSIWSLFYLNFDVIFLSQKLF
jgi:hypothetical protein